MRKTTRTLLGLLAGVALVTAACGGDDDDSAGAAEPGTESSAAAASGDFTVGFIYVGPKDDFGYNQAAYQGSLAVANLGIEVLQAENVPETSEAESVMEDMIDQGADLIFATSFGHLEFARNVAQRHPEVVIVHQGGLEGEPALDNLGTYFGTVYEPVYTAGIAAGSVTETGKLGYVYAFPIPQTLANINAFTLGAQSVDPDIEVITISTGNWCDPGLQAEAAESLIDQGVDVITQHQDCTKTIIEAAEAAGIYSVGYHADASELAPKGWITGSEWNWDALYVDITETVMAGDFVDSPYNGDYRVGLQTGDNPFVQSTFGPMVGDDVKELIEAKRQEFIDGGSPFAGPVLDQKGTTVWAEGEQPTYDEVETMDFFVQGVVGTIG